MALQLADQRVAARPFDGLASACVGRRQRPTRSADAAAAGVRPVRRRRPCGKQQAGSDGEDSDHHGRPCRCDPCGPAAGCGEDPDAGTWRGSQARSLHAAGSAERQRLGAEQGVGFGGRRRSGHGRRQRLGATVAARGASPARSSTAPWQTSHSVQGVAASAGSAAACPSTPWQGATAGARLRRQVHRQVGPAAQRQQREQQPQHDQRGATQRGTHPRQHSAAGCGIAAAGLAGRRQQDRVSYNAAHSNPTAAPRLPR